uniref:nucleoside-diphosphate kinase n=1 Tax=Meloidogyne hapla TaxID=6305 RepID=A0A1I8BKJ8_MELHA
MSNKERTFIAIKPDGVQRGLVNKIIKQFEQRGYKLVAIKMVQASRQHLEGANPNSPSIGFYFY